MTQVSKFAYIAISQNARADARKYGNGDDMRAEIGEKLFYIEHGRVKKATVLSVDGEYLRLSNGATYSISCIGLKLFYTETKAEASKRLVAQ